MVAKALNHQVLKPTSLKAMYEVCFLIPVLSGVTPEHLPGDQYISSPNACDAAGGASSVSALTSRSLHAT